MAAALCLALVAPAVASAEGTDQKGPLLLDTSERADRHNPAQARLDRQGEAAPHAAGNFGKTTLLPKWGPRGGPPEEIAGLGQTTVELSDRPRAQEHGRARGAAAGHGDGHDAGEVKEHLRHFSLWNVLVPGDAAASLRGKLAGVPGMKRSFYDKVDFAHRGDLAHVFWALVAFGIVLGLALAARGRLERDEDAGVLPERRVSPLLFFEVLVGATYKLMQAQMGAELARRYLPIIGTLAVYIFTMNILSLLPFGAPATDNLNTNAGMALTVFFATHYAGIRAQGPGHYLKHFMGPVAALAPLIFVLEVISHLARPVSLSLRLMGNMTGDHNVLFEFTYFQIPLLPLPVMALGLLVCVVQTMVFVILSTVYLSIAVDAGHADEAHAH